MKILSVRGKNLASLEDEFCLDFSQEPLASAGIFAITGHTGAGKSTLLDAICLALYNNTPRLRVRRTGVSVSDGENKSISLFDPRSLLRRGTGEGYAEVEFLALDGHRYRALWSVRRAGKLQIGNLQKVSYSVFDMTTNVAVSGTFTELLKKVEQLVGLNFEQFTRAVMLAQGDFATFLKADDMQKAELLEKLTGTEIYSEISAKIFEKASNASSELAQLQEKLNGIVVMDDAKRDELLGDKKSYEQFLDGAQKKLDKLKEMQAWLTKNSAMKCQLSEAKQNQEEHQKQYDLAAPRRDVLQKVDEVQSVRDDYQQWKESEKSIKANEDLLHKNQEEWEKLNFERSAVEKGNADAQSEQDSCKAERKMLEPQVKQAREKDKDIKTVLESIVKEKLSRSEHSRSVVNFKDQKEEIEKTAEQLKKELDSLEGWFKEYDLYRPVMDDYNVVGRELKNASSALRCISTYKTAIENANHQLADCKNQLEESKKKKKELDEALPQHIAALRESLVENEPCPVCGSLHHPFMGQVYHAMAKENIEQLKNQVEESINFNQGQILNFEKLIAENRGSIKNDQKSYDESCDYLTKICPDFKVENLESIKNEIDKLHDEWVINEAHQKLWCDNQRNAKIELDKIAIQIENEQKLLTQCEDELVQKQDDLEKLQEERAEMLDGRAADDVARDYQKRCDEVEQKVKEITEKLVSLNSKISALEGQNITLKRNVDDLLRKRNQTNDVIEVWLNARQGVYTRERVEHYIQFDGNWIAQERKVLNALYQQCRQDETLVQEREKQWQKHQLEDSKPNDGETAQQLAEQSSLLSQELNDKRQLLVDVTVKLKTDDENKELVKTYEKDLDAKGAQAKSWEQLNVVFGSKNGDKFKKMAQSYTLEVLLGYANNHLTQLTDRYRLERIPGESLALQVVDMDMLNEVRSVMSLSGGESFLVSLALALGLSSLSSKQMSVESLFIDEGFGSLDSDSLSMVMDALERLQNQGRKIGVISHVTEMMERIPTQIQVMKESNGKSVVRVVANY